MTTVAVKPIILVFVAPSFLLPIGVITACLGRRRKGALVLGIIFILISIPVCWVMSPLYLWLFDRARGWELRLSTDEPPYAVTLVQQAGDDFYNSYFEICRSDGRKAIVSIDTDDSRWWNPHIVRQDGKTYFVRGSGAISDRTSYVDSAHDVLFSGYYERTYTISGLEFE